VKLRIALDGKIYEVEYDTLAEGSPHAVAPIDRVQSIVLSTPVASPSDGDESKLCRSPVAGIVTRINVEPGQSVEAEDIVVVVEAMKMENNLVAAKAQKTKLVKVKTGDPVKAGQIVVEFE